MSHPGVSDYERARIPPCDADLTFLALKSKPRLRVLAALARRGPQIGADLKTFGRGHGPCHGNEHFVDSTLKNLKIMVAAGIVVELDNPQDRRRTRYALTPLARVTHTPEETIVDFGFCFVRFPTDWK